MATADRLVVPAVALCLLSVAVNAGDSRGEASPANVAAEGVQSPAFHIGRPATPEEIKAIDIDVTPDGRGLPPGHGTAAAGKAVYAARCVTCHGATGTEGPQDVLVGSIGSLATAKPLKTVGSYLPYATTVWDYIHRAMPFDHPGTLTTDEVYAVTAYLLFLNGIVGEHDVTDQTTLPRVVMPNRNGFVADPRPDVGGATKAPAKPGGSVRR
jgi:mono/diheme cytochrome c family protein